MTTPVVETAAEGLTSSAFRAMASTITVATSPATANHDAVLAAIAEIFEDVERQCTRFDPTSDLMRANAAGDWTPVGSYCFRALHEASLAYVASDGRFDPRVLRTLQNLGYGTSLAFAAGPITTDESGPVEIPAARPWTPQFDRDGQRVAVGPDPIDLGGIGKGLAVRWAAARAAELSSGFLVDAGGDCYLHGTAPDGQPWRVGIEDPSGGAAPLAVLALSDAACVTSSIRLRRWQAGSRAVHHLIDPRTGLPGGDGLLAVTVVGPDPARAEVWSKVLFLHGADGIAAAADGLAAAWVDTDSVLHVSAKLRPYVMWQA